MPSVASEAKTHALNPPSPQVPLPAPASDRTSASPFESLLDSGARSAPPPPDRHKTAKADAAKPDRPIADSARNNAAKSSARTKTSDTEKPGKADKPEPNKAAEIDTTDTGDTTDETGKIAAELVAASSEDGTDKTAADEKIIDGKHGHDGKAKTDGKKTDAKTDSTTDIKIDVQADAGTLTPPDAEKPAIVAAAVNTAPPPVHADSASVPSKDAAIAATPVTTPPPVAAAATAALAPVDETVKLAAQTAQPADALAAEIPKGKPAAHQSAQSDAGESADDTGATEAPAKDAQTAQADKKPQAGVNVDKQAIARARGETVADSHRASKADAARPAANANANATAAKPSADVLQTLAVNPPPHNAAAAAAIAATPAPQVAAQTPVPLAGVAIAIAGKALEGKNRFEIRLDPPELGRIEVRLDVDRDGQVTSHLIAHRAETLDLLRRDAAGLQRALQDAGLKTADNGLQFSLHDQSTGRQQDAAGTKTAQLVVQDETSTAAEPTASSYARLAQLRGGLDIRV